MFEAPHSPLERVGGCVLLFSIFAFFLSAFLPLDGAHIENAVLHEAPGSPETDHKS